MGVNSAMGKPSQGKRADDDRSALLRQGLGKGSVKWGLRCRVPHFPPPTLWVEGPLESNTADPDLSPHY